jgi:retinol dehydrogenase-12
MMMESKAWISGKTCLITGANAGIGKETAIKLARLGARIFMACRDRGKADQARAEIVATTGNEAIEVLPCDLASLNDVKRFAGEFARTRDRLHVLINNAGIYSTRRITTLDGYESTFAVDYLAHFYLTSLLLDTMKASAPARIINLSSNIHLYFGIAMNDLLSERRYNGQKAYSNAKAAMVLFTRKLARDLDGTGVTVNTVHPGHARTKMTTEGLPRWFVAITSKFQASAEQAAETPAFMASDPGVASITGAYFSKCKPAKPARFTGRVDMQETLWRASKDLVDKVVH